MLKFREFILEHWNIYRLNLWINCFNGQENKWNLNSTVISQCCVHENSSRIFWLDIFCTFTDNQTTHPSDLSSSMDVSCLQISWGGWFINKTSTLTIHGKQMRQMNKTHKEHKGECIFTSYLFSLLCVEF